MAKAVPVETTCGAARGQMSSSSARQARDRGRIKFSAKLRIALRHLAEEAVGLEANGNRPTFSASATCRPATLPGAESFSTLAVPSVG